MLTLIQPPFGLSILAWISFAPFIVACSPKIKTSRLFWVPYIIGIFYWLGNLYWIAPITIVGWIILCIYLGLHWPMLAFCFRWCRKKNLPLFFASAIIIVGVERSQGIFLGGFFWRFLAHSQFENITIIQIADIFGAGGVSFLIAIVNGLAAELFIAARQKRIINVRLFLRTAIVCGLLLASFLYGRWRLNQESKAVVQGPLVASLQSNVPQSVKSTFESGAELFYGLMADSNDASETKPDLIVWPETMVQSMLNPEVLQLVDPNSEWVAFDRKLKIHAYKNAYLLVGAYGGTLVLNENLELDYGKRFNSAFLFNPGGGKEKEVYNKIHLVPFGEVLPLRKSMAWFYRILMNIKFIPYDFDYSLDYGSEHTIFKMAPGLDPNRKEYKFSVMICYEDTVPEIARKFTLDEKKQKRIDWLVNISNDGWFVRFIDPDVHPSSELAQHTAICAFRAIENRLAVVRSVNTGISCIIDSYGRIKDGYKAGTLPEKALERKGISGWFADTIPIDRRITFFSKYGEIVDYSCEILTILLIIWLILTRFLRNKKFGLIPVKTEGTPNEKNNRKN